MSSNQSLHKAAQAQQDEFYTQYTDVQEELNHYWPHFRGIATPKRKPCCATIKDYRITNPLFSLFREFATKQRDGFISMIHHGGTRNEHQA